MTSRMAERVFMVFQTLLMKSPTGWLVTRELLPGVSVLAAASMHHAGYLE